MGFFDRFLSRADEAPLPGLTALMEARGLPADLPGLAALIPAFEAHRKASEREAWVEALVELQAQGLPLPEPWIEAQDQLLPELVPAWLAEREGRWSRGYIDGLSQRIRLGEMALPAPWLILWDQPADEVLELALDHLRQRSEGGFERLPSGAYRSPWRDGLDAARLLLPEVWQGLFKDQHPFLAIPATDTLLAVPQILLPKLMDEVRRSIQSGANPLQLAVIDGLGPLERYAWVDSALRTLAGSGIVYVSTVAETERLSSYLRHRGHDVPAGMNKTVFDSWLTKVATRTL